MSVLITLLCGCAAQAPSPQPDQGSSIASSTTASLEKSGALDASRSVNAAGGKASTPAAEAAVASPEKTAALQRWVAQQDRLERVAAPLLLNNVKLCQRHARPVSGFNARTKYAFSSAFVAEAGSALGLDERLRIVSVMPASGAASSGLLNGDILVAAEGELFPTGQDAESAAVLLLRRKMRGRTSVNLQLLREEKKINLRVPFTSACGMTVLLGNSDAVNSYADGNRLLITRGMLNFTQSDQELAYVLAKEIAHNALSRAVRPSMRSVIDNLHGNPSASGKMVKISPYKPVVDATADKIALYMLARSGYDIDAVPDFWKRLATAYPMTLESSHTSLHPSTNYRLSVISQIVKTIKLKQQNQLPLIP